MPTDDSHPSEMSRKMAERLALPSGGYPDVWAMSQDEYDECYSKWLSIWTDSQCDEDAIDGYLAPDQIEFRNALEARFNKDMEDEDREYDKNYSALVDEGFSPEKARKVASQRHQDYLHKRYSKETFSHRIKGSIMLALFFPVALVWNIWKPGIFRELYPRTRSVVQGVGNWLMMALLAFLLLFPPCVMAHPVWEMRQLFLILMIPTMFVAAIYAPWYIILSMILFWILWAAASAIRYGSGHPPTTWTALWFWMWTLYPFVRGILHILQWERERKAGLPNHRVTKHPVALGLTSLGIAVGSHYIAKHGKKKD